MCYFIHIQDTQRNPFSLSCNVYINAYSKRVRDQIPANKLWPMDFIYANWDAPADNTDKLKPGKMVLCVKTKARPPSLGSVRLIMADYWRTSRNQQPKRPLLVCAAVLMAGVANGLWERTVGIQWCRWPFHPVSQLLSAGGGAAAIPHRDAAIEGNLRSPVSTFCYSKCEHGSTPSVASDGECHWKIPKSTDMAVRLIHLRKAKCLTIVQRPAMLGMEMNTRKRGAWGKVMNHTEKCAWTSETAVQHLINAPWRQVLCNMEISQSYQKESYCTHCCPTGWWLFMVHLFSVLPLWYYET